MSDHPPTQPPTSDDVARQAMLEALATTELHDAIARILRDGDHGGPRDLVAREQADSIMQLLRSREHASVLASIICIANYSEMLQVFGTRAAEQAGRAA